MLQPDWTKDAAFSREYTDDQGRLIEVYDKKGIQDNFIYIVKDTKAIIRIEQVPNDDQTFDEASFSTQVDPAVFQLPAVCNNATSCGRLTTCGLVPKVQQAKATIDY